MSDQPPDLQQYLAKLTRRVKSLPSSERVNSLESANKQLSEALAQLSEQVSHLQQQFESAIADIPNQIETKVRDRLKANVPVAFTAIASNDSQSWRCVNTLSAHRGGVNAIALSRDGQQLVSTGADGTLKIWQLAPESSGADFNPEPIGTLVGKTGDGNCIAISPSGQTAVVGGWQIKIWQPSTGVVPRTLSGHGSAVAAIAISPDGETLVSGARDNTIKLWHASTGDEYRTLYGHAKPVTAIAILPDGQLLASGGWDNTLKIWQLDADKDAAMDKPLCSLSGHGDNIAAIACSPSPGDRGTPVLIASGSWDKTIKIWQLDTNKEGLPTAQLLHTLCGHSDNVTAVAISPDGKTLASGSSDETIRIWHISTGELLQTLSGHLGGVNAVAFSPQSQTLVSGSQDMTIKLWRCD